MRPSGRDRAPNEAERELVYRQTVLVLSDLDELSNRNSGDIRGLSEPAVKARLHRARLFLRGQLAVSFGYAPA